MSEKRFYITTPIFYPNAELHMGHAYTTVLSDIIARFKRLEGYRTHFLTGSDEHGSKVAKAAKLAGKEPQEYVDELSQKFKDLFQELDVSYDQFIRTSDKEIHYPGAELLWNKLVEAGDIYKGHYEGLYCIGCETFYTEKDLVDGKCPLHNTVPELVREENYFFKLSKYSNTIRGKIESDELRVIPETRKKEILSVLEGGLSDVSFSRPKESVSWGIPVPGDESQVMYVWCDALSNYITAIGYGRDEKMFTDFWPADLHVIGKDILRFHAAIWPGMLLSARLPLPKAILAHGFITSGGKKMSKSLGNVINPKDLIEEYGEEALRYFIGREISPLEDGDITPEAFKESYNANLANGIGNLASRILTMAVSYDAFPETYKRELNKEFETELSHYRVHKAADIVFTEIQQIDVAIQVQEPFKIYKTDPKKARAIVSDLVQKLSNVAFHLEPFLPKAAQKIQTAISEKRVPETLFPRKD